MFKLRTFLIITTILLVLISIQFLFSTANNNKKNDDLITGAEFQKILCSNKTINGKKPWKEQQCPRHGFVTVKPNNRLGNNMWQYISVWGVAIRTGLEAYVSRCHLDTLSNAFDSLTVPTLDEISHCMVNKSGFAKSLEEWNHNYQGIMVDYDTFLVDVALTWVEDVRKQFTFRKDLVSKSQDILCAFVKNSTNKVFVGVHVRRTDYWWFLYVNYYLKLPKASYYYSAMKYYEDKYKDVAFILTSDDTKWCIEQYSNKSNVFIVATKFNNSRYLDMAVLAACNHSIYDHGSYGGWSAILAGGETIFYKLKDEVSEKVAKLLPNWHAME